MSQPRPRSTGLIGAGSWALAIALGLLLKSTAVAVALGVVGAVFLLVGLAGTQGAQRYVPILGTIPFLAASGDDPVLAGGSTEAERRELLRLAHGVAIELETGRSRLLEVTNAKRGWRALPREQYYGWSRSTLTVDEAEVNSALEHYYVWAGQMNHHMAERAANEETSIGQVLYGKGLELDASDIAELDEGLSLLRNAQEHLKSRMGELIARGRRSRLAASWTD